MKKQFFILATLLLVFALFNKENELKKSVFIYDSEYPDLPAYSEWGYNTFGAYYDRDIFVSNNDIVPAKSFILDGQKGVSDYDNSKEMIMTFDLSGLSPEQYSNLIILNDTIFDLENPLYKVLVSIDTIKYTANILSGELTFKRSQNLLVDKKQVEVILSGYFEFKALIDDEPVTISNGRFDVGISPDNFYSY
ncbi:MAG: hypothetical protein HY738_15750 [Bacteroidia bacterium]|nr:hypothetical protein [Bacteroidia bacterium]